MAIRINPQPNLTKMQALDATPTHALENLQPLSEPGLVHLNSLLFPANGFHYCYQVITPWAVRTVLEFSFDLKLFFQQLDMCCALRGIAIKKVSLTREAAHAVLIKQEGIPLNLDLEIQVEGGGGQSVVDEAVLTAFQKTVQTTTGNLDISYEFFKTNGLKTPYIASQEGGTVFAFPARLGDKPCALNFRASASPAGRAVFSTDCFQIDVSSSLLGQWKPPSVSACVGYDFQEAYTLAQQGVFDIRIEGAAACPDGAYEYLHLLTAGNSPRSLRGERALWEGLQSQLGTEEIKKKWSGKLQRHLAERYKNDLRGALFYLVNMEDFIARAPDCAHKAQMRETIAELLVNRLQVETEVNPELFLAHCKVHLFLFLLKDAPKSKFYFDHSNQPVYRIAPEGGAGSLFTEFPVREVHAVFSGWDACLAIHNVLEGEFPLEPHHYEGLVRSHLTSLRSTDYPSQRETLSLLEFVCGGGSANVPRFLQGIIERIHRKSTSEERVLLIENEWGVINLFRKEAPLDLEPFKANPEHCEEAMVAKFSSSKDPELVAFALEMAGQVMERGEGQTVMPLLLNPAAQADPRAQTYARKILSSAGDEDPRARLSLFFRYRVEGKAHDEGRLLISLLNANQEAVLNGDEKQRLKEIVEELFPKLLAQNLPLARTLFDSLGENECRTALCQQLVSTLLVSAESSVFESGLEMCVARMQELTPTGVAESLKGALGAAKDVSRFKRLVAAIKGLEGKYFSAQQGNIEECMRRVRVHFPNCLLEVADLVSSVPLPKRSEWIREVMKLKSQNAFACCKKMLENPQVFGPLEEDLLVWIGYIQLAASLKDRHPHAASLYLQKEQWLLTQLDIDPFLSLFLMIFPLLPQEAQAEEQRFVRLFGKIEKGGVFERKVEVLQLFLKRFSGRCSESLALCSLQVVRSLSSKNLKSELGASLFNQVAVFLGQGAYGDAALRSLAAAFHKVRESLSFAEGYLYREPARNVMVLVMGVVEDAEREQRWRVDEALSLLHFMVEKRACEEALFFEQMKQVLVRYQEVFSFADLKGILKLAVEAGASSKTIEEGPFLSIVLPLSAIVRRMLTSAAQDAEVHGLTVLWTAFCHGQQKRCGRAKPQTASMLAMVEIQLRSVAALQILKLPYTNGHTMAGVGDSHYRRGVSEVQQAVECFVQAADEHLFFHVSHMRQSFAELSVAMLHCETLRSKVLRLIKTRNFTGRDYFDLIDRMQNAYKESSDPQLFKELYHTSSFALLNDDLAKALSIDEMKYLVNNIGFFALQQLSVSNKEDSGTELKYAVRCVQLFVVVGTKFPAVLEYCRENEREFLAGLYLVFERIINSKNKEFLPEFGECLASVRVCNVLSAKERIDAMLHKIQVIKQNEVLSNYDSKRPLSLAEVKSLIDSMGFFAVCKTAEGSENELKEALKSLQFIVLVGTSFPPVMECCKQHEEEFLTGLSLIFEGIVKIENSKLVAEFAEYLSWVQKSAVVTHMERVDAMMVAIPEIQQRLVRTAEIKKEIDTEQKK